MTDIIKISQLDENTAPKTTDMLPMVDETNIVTDRVSIANILALIATNAGGWNSLPYTLAYSANNGNRSFAITTTGDVTSLLSPGMRMQVTRNVAPPTQCMAFVAASSQYATKASPSGITFTGTFTCEAWIYLNSLTNQSQMIVNRRTNGGTSGGWRFYIDNSGRVIIEYGSGANFTNFISLQSVPLNRWVHVAGVITSIGSKTGLIYIDGNSVPTTSSLSAATTLAQESVDLRVGASSATPANTYFDGYMSEVRVWSTNQSQSSIQGNMGINLTGSETNLVALYKGSGAWTDGTSNANTLTANGGAVNNQAANPYNLVEYAIITAVSYANPTSTITLQTASGYTIPNATMITPYYSGLKYPFGFPADRAIWSIEAPINNHLNRTTLSPNTITNLGGAKITLPVGSWELFWRGPAVQQNSSADIFSIYMALSTSSSAFSDLDLMDGSIIRAVSASAHVSTLGKQKPVKTTALTDFFVMLEYQQGSGTITVGIQADSTQGNFNVRAEFAYL